MKAVIDVWRDITTLSDLDAAKQIMADEIDVLIDVNGYTKLARTKIFSYRPAPVIVNFCGYPGTMASPVHQYIIADEQIIPPGNEVYYTEKVLHIPCNQPVDRKRVIGPRPTRAEYGLPENAFVFACFNGMQKITAAVFSRWMTILTETPGSILWLLGGSDAVNQRLRELASAAGVDPSRLHFASKVPNPNHLARIAIADLFLDTFPYGAHSTASDSLTMGLPVLTVPGKSFASRFCSSIVKSAGIPELICATPDDYVRQAIALAKDRDALAASAPRCRHSATPAPCATSPASSAVWKNCTGRCRVSANGVRRPSPISPTWTCITRLARRSCWPKSSSRARPPTESATATASPPGTTSIRSPTTPASGRRATCDRKQTDSSLGWEKSVAPVILVTFAGREARMEILTRYIRAAMAEGLIDEWHVWDFTRSAADHQWVSREFGPVRFMGDAVGYQPCGTASRRAPLRLDARITNDLHLAILPKDDPATAYEVVVGGWNNQQSVIRKMAREKLAEADRSEAALSWARLTPSVLSRAGSTSSSCRWTKAERRK